LKILVDIGHPAHVHLFKHFAWNLIKKGNTVLFTVRAKDINIELLNSYGFNYIIYGRSRKGLFNKLVGLFKYDISLLKIIRKIKPDISISHSSFYLSHICWFLHIPNITLEDTGNSEQVNLYRFFTNSILTSNAFHKNYGSKQIRYKGYHELAYLYPTYFKPNEQVLKDLGLNTKEKFVLLRFISWNASHDLGQKGISLEDKIKIIELLESKYKIFISSEEALPERFIPYQLQLSPDRIHDILYFADLYIGEGATMASESAILGTPAIYVNSIGAGTISDQEKYGLLFHFRTGKGVFDKVKELIVGPDLRTEFDIKKNKRLNDRSGCKKSF